MVEQLCWIALDFTCVQNKVAYAGLLTRECVHLLIYLSRFSPHSTFPVT